MSGGTKKKENGLVLREVKVGESTRMLTILTARHGVVSASAKGALNPKSKLFSATGLFCYAEFLLREGRNTYFVDEADVIDVFFGLRQSVEGIALATYIAELAMILSPTAAESAALLHLVLLALHSLAGGKQAPGLVKPAFELRALADNGYMPNLVGCAECGRYDGIPFYFDAQKGELLCAGCAGDYKQEPNLSPGALAALRHVVLAEEAKVFGFALGAGSTRELNRCAEEFMLYHIDYPPRSLAFLKTLEGADGQLGPGAPETGEKPDAAQHTSEEEKAEN